MILVTTPIHISTMNINFCSRCDIIVLSSYMRYENKIFIKKEKNQDIKKSFKLKIWFCVWGIYGAFIMGGRWEHINTPSQWKYVSIYIFIITKLGCITLNHINQNFHPHCIIGVGNNYLAVTYYVLPWHAFAACSHLSIMELRLKEKRDHWLLIIGIGYKGGLSSSKDLQICPPSDSCDSYVFLGK